MRYTKEHKQETRQRIIATAGRRFKRDGIDGSGVATLMKDAGLTNGAFYAHFASKDDLVATAVADQLQRTAREHRRAGGARPGRTRADRALVPVARAPGQPRRRLPQRRPARRDRALHGRDQAGVHRRRAGRSSTASPPAWHPRIRPRPA